MNGLFVKIFRFAALFVAALGVFAVTAHAQDAPGIYKAKCAVCHGPDGKADTAVGKKLGARDFASPDVAKESDEQLIEVVTKGRNKMPAYGTSLKDTQIKDLVGYLRDLAKKK
jgi:mono/diheme cytochrome c family protein